MAKKRERNKNQREIETFAKLHQSTMFSQHVCTFVCYGGRWQTVPFPQSLLKQLLWYSFPAKPQIPLGGHTLPSHKKMGKEFKRGGWLGGLWASPCGPRPYVQLSGASESGLCFPTTTPRILQPAWPVRGFGERCRTDPWFPGRQGNGDGPFAFPWRTCSSFRMPSDLDTMLSEAPTRFSTFIVLPGAIAGVKCN